MSGGLWRSVVPDFPLPEKPSSNGRFFFDDTKEENVH